MTSCHMHEIIFTANNKMYIYLAFNVARKNLLMSLIYFYCYQHHFLQHKHYK